MKTLKMMLTGPVVFLFASSAALAGDFDWLKDLNIKVNKIR